QNIPGRICYTSRMSLHRRGGSGGGRRNHAIAGALLAAFAGACAAPPSERAQTASRAEAQEEPQPGAGLSAAMLYDILLARIAVQRGRNRIAMDAYMRAAQRSQRRDLAEKALLLAMRLNAHPRVVELSAMLGKMGTPDNSLRLPSPKSESDTDKETAALHLLVEIARSFPRDEKVMREVAATLIQQSRRPGRANTLPRFRAAAAAWPNSAALHLVTALLARDMKEDDTAAESIDAALQFRPGWQSAAIFKLTHLANTSISAMRDFAEEFLRAHPQAARARIQYGKLLLRSERAKQSLAQFEKVLAQQPDSPDALLSAGIAHAKLKNPDQALLQLRKFLKAHPQHDQARLHIAAAETARNNFAAAADTLHEISAPQHALDAQLQLAAVTAARDGIEAGIEHLLQLQPRDAAERVRIVLEQDSLFRKYGMPARAL
ncbi:MAG: tetratricopeptide repeat protein, partial [Gammaproteobacteria bacterium]